MIRIAIVLALVSIGACGEQYGADHAPVGSPSAPARAQIVDMPFAKTFKVYERDGYRIIDLKAPIVSWGGDAKGADQTARVVLVPKDAEPPAMTGDLQSAVLVRTPVERIAVNYGFLEAILTTLNVEGRLVAIGGVKSYNDEIRARARSGDVAQVGYGWHAPPAIDTLIGARPDVFFTVLGDLGHAEHYERIKSLGVPVVPIFLEAETTYMGPVDYVRLLAMFVDKEDAANVYADMVANNVDALKARVADKPKKQVMSAWFAGGGRWMVTVRNAENQLLSDAGGVNPMALQDDIRLDDFMRTGSETLLARARNVDCWIIRDTHSQAFTDEDFLQNFKAWREGCLFASDGSTKAEADAFDYYETGPLRPDYVLRDLVRMLHPDASSAPFKYIQPDNETPRP